MGITSCPGQHLYDLLPDLRKDVSIILLSKKSGQTVDRIHHHLDPVMIDDKATYSMRYTSSDVSLRGDVTCERKDPTTVPLAVRSCRVE